MAREAHASTNSARKKATASNSLIRPSKKGVATPVTNNKRGKATNATVPSQRISRSSNKAKASSASHRRRLRKSTQEDREDGDDDLPINVQDLMSDLDDSRGGTEIYRIGRMPNRREVPNGGSGTDNMVDMDVVIVAVCRPTKSIQFRAVHTWQIDGETVGCFSNSEVINRIRNYYLLDDDDEQWFSPDSFFHDAIRKKTLRQVLTALVAGKPHEDIPTDQQMLDTPFKPTRTNKNPKEEAPKYPDRRRNDPVNVIFEFVNEGAVEDLVLNANNQAEVNENDQPNSYEAFLAAVTAYQNDKGPYGGKTIDQTLNGDDGMLWWCDLEIWILPQWDADGKMYNWTREKRLRITHFLDDRASRTHGRNLYAEVRIKPKRNWQISQEAWWTRHRGRPGSWRSRVAYKAVLGK